MECLVWVLWGKWSCHDAAIKWKHFRVTGPLWGVTGGFPSQGPVTRSFDIFFDLRQNTLLIKQSKRRWFETPSHSYDVTVIYDNVQHYRIFFHNSFCYSFPHCIVMWNILRCYSTWDPIVYQCQYSVFSISYLQISLMTIWTLVQKPKLQSSVA